MREEGDLSTFGKVPQRAPLAKFCSAESCNAAVVSGKMRSTGGRQSCGKQLQPQQAATSWPGWHSRRGAAAGAALCCSLQSQLLLVDGVRGQRRVAAAGGGQQAHENMCE